MALKKLHTLQLIPWLLRTVKPTCHSSKDLGHMAKGIFEIQLPPKLQPCVWPIMLRHAQTAQWTIVNVQGLTPEDEHMLNIGTLGEKC